MSESLSPTNSLDRDILSRDINDAIDALPSARQRSRVQSMAYLLGARQEPPDFDDVEINRTRTVQLAYDAMEGNTINLPTQCQELKKGELHLCLSLVYSYVCVTMLVEFRVPLNTTDGSKQTTYVDQLYSESDIRADILDSIRAAMDVPKSYEHLGWRISTARRTDLPHRLLTVQDVDSAFKAVRAEQSSGQRKKTNAAIEIVNTVCVSVSH